MIKVVISGNVMANKSGFAGMILPTSTPTTTTNPEAVVNNALSFLCNLSTCKLIYDSFFSLQFKKKSFLKILIIENSVGSRKKVLGIKN